jgi:hypothetical protein
MDLTMSIAELQSMAHARAGRRRTKAERRALTPDNKPALLFLAPFILGAGGL